MFLGCVIFTVLGILAERGIITSLPFDRFIGIAAIIFFGCGGLLYFALMAWKPIAVISSEGITVPHGWGENFVVWKNVDRFEVVVQTIGGRYPQKQKYIGIFVTDTEWLAGAGDFSQEITRKVTGWEEVPGLLINLSFSFVKIEKVMRILQEFYDEYGNSLSGEAFRHQRNTIYN